MSNLTDNLQHLQKAGFKLPKRRLPSERYASTSSDDSSGSDDDAATHISFAANSPNGAFGVDDRRGFEKESSPKRRRTVFARHHHRAGAYDSDSDFSSTSAQKRNSSTSIYKVDPQSRATPGNDLVLNADKNQIALKSKEIEDGAKEVKAAWNVVRSTLRSIMFVDQWEKGRMEPITSTLQDAIDRLVEKSTINKSGTSTNTQSI
ncbi:hypothetical protein FQN49_008237 [Arthroderma sp. PD_2]|nr:hypothetical protein FQN49_008237 [Arthroderma sp. PD_2]